MEALESFFYYKKLNYKQKQEFARRVHHFLRTKKFIEQNISLNESMKVWIAATAVKISFGLNPVLYNRFKIIIVYPDAYYSPLGQNIHLGEVSPKLGIIKLSWHHFVEGYMDFGDGRNLGIHEMAHALKFENLINNGQSNFFPKKILQKWILQVNEAFEVWNSAQKNGVELESPIRAYGYSNHFEFFSVCMELFFECPAVFYKAHPNLYQTLSELLKQDPLRGIFQIK